MGAAVVAFVADLMDRSRIVAALGDDVTFVTDPPAAAGAALVVVDLAGSGSRLAEIRAVTSGRIVAFGPHVDADLLEQATRAGADAVLPRSRFFADPAGAMTGR